MMWDAYQWYSHGLGVFIGGSAIYAIVVASRMKRRYRRLEEEIVSVAEQMNDAIDELEGAIAALSTRMGGISDMGDVLNQIVGPEARKALIIANDTRERILPLIMAKLGIKAEGGTLH